MIRKLKSKKGESIGEVLVAMLVVSLGSILFASMVSASQRLATRSKKAYDSYVTARSQMESESGNTISTESSKVLLESDPEGTSDSKRICGISNQAKEEVTVYINSGAESGVSKKFIYKPKSESDSRSDGGSGS